MGVPQFKTVFCGKTLRTGALCIAWFNAITVGIIWSMYLSLVPTLFDNFDDYYMQRGGSQEQVYGYPQNIGGGSQGQVYGYPQNQIIGGGSQGQVYGYPQNQIIGGGSQGQVYGYPQNQIIGGYLQKQVYDYPKHIDDNDLQRQVYEYHKRIDNDLQRQVYEYHKRIDNDLQRQMYEYHKRIDNDLQRQVYEYHKRIDNDLQRQMYEYHKHIDIASRSCITVIAVLLTYYFIVECLLLWGVLKKKVYMLLAWIVVTSLIVCIGLLTSIISFIAGIYIRENFFILIIPISTLNALLTYFWLIIYSYYREIKNEKRKNKNSTNPEPSTSQQNTFEIA